MTTYTVRVVGSDSSVGQGCTVCTTSPCLYVTNRFVQKLNSYFLYSLNVGEGYIAHDKSSNL